MNKPTPMNDLAERDYPRPTVNLNGNTARGLADEVIAVRRAMNDLQDAMAKATPHGRDYQTLPSYAYTEARAAWSAAQANVSLASGVVNEYYYHLANELNRTKR